MNKKFTCYPLLFTMLIVASCANDSDTDASNGSKPGGMPGGSGAPIGSLPAGPGTQIITMPQDPGQPIAGWVTVSDSMGGFSIQFPRKPEMVTETQLVNKKQVEWHRYTVNAQGPEDNNQSYKLSYTTDKALADPKLFEGMVKEQTEYLQKSSNAKLTSDKAMPIPNGKGRDQVYTMNEQPVQVRYQVILKDGIFYSLTVMTNKDKAANIDIERFTASLKFVDKASKDKKL